MKIALVNNQRSKPFPKGRGLCPICKKEVIAKCGTKIIHHWAHRSEKHCDKWWENETQWHRDWKNKFPEDWQEVVHFADDGEKHIADIKTSKGIVIELQNSLISVEEMKSREQFYKKMVWVVNGDKFKKRFHILGKLPKPGADFVNDIIFYPQKHTDAGRLYYRISESATDSNFVHIRSIKEIQDDIDLNYIGHHLFDWIRPRAVWYETNCDTFIDFNDGLLWKLMEYGTNKLKCVRKYDKTYFVKRALEMK